MRFQVWSRTFSTQLVAATRDYFGPIWTLRGRMRLVCAFLIYYGRINSSAEALKDLGFTTAALALRADSINIDDPALAAAPRLALILGSEGWGLPAPTIEASDHTVCIPMHHTVDSLNVAATAAIALWQLRRR